MEQLVDVLHRRFSMAKRFASSRAAESHELQETLLSQDVEAQGDEHVQAQAQDVPAIYKVLVLAAYFVLSLWIPISNKAVFEKARFPWLLTAVHALATSAGCLAALTFGRVKLTRLTNREHVVLLGFSLLFTLNIAFSNVSLAMVSVPFHQILRSTIPLITILIYRFVYGHQYPTATYLTMIPLIVGIGLCTAGDYYATLIGFSLTFLGVVLSAIKAVATNRLMTGSLALSAVELLVRMSPLAALQCFAVALAVGEVSQFRTAYAEGTMPPSFHANLLLNTSIAVALNVVSFQSVKLLGALTTAVFGNVRQVLTILLGIVIFQVPVGLLSGAGMVVTTIGAIWYSKVELENKSG